METGQFSIEWLLSEGRKKEIKDFLELNENECITYLDLGATMKVVI